LHLALAFVVWQDYIVFMNDANNTPPEPTMHDITVAAVTRQLDLAVSLEACAYYLAAHGELLTASRAMYYTAPTSAQMSALKARATEQAARLAKHIDNASIYAI